MNLSKKNDPRYWNKWAASGALQDSGRGWSADSLTPLPANHYLVSMRYGGMPSPGELKKMWGCLSEIFDGRPFTNHTSCIGVDRTPGQRVFYLHSPDGEWMSENQIELGLRQRSEVAPNGYRPATHEETYEFHEVYSHLVDLAGLGSFAEYKGDRCVACIIETRDGPFALSHSKFDQRASRWLRTLFVCR